MSKEVYEILITSCKIVPTSQISVCTIPQLATSIFLCHYGYQQLISFKTTLNNYLKKTFVKHFLNLTLNLQIFYLKVWALLENSKRKYFNNIPIKLFEIRKNCKFPFSRFQTDGIDVYSLNSVIVILSRLPKIKTILLKKCIIYEFTLPLTEFQIEVINVCLLNLLQLSKVAY